MVPTLFLWLTVLLFSFHLAGHFFDIIANQSNWKSGQVNDIKRYVNFYQKSNPGTFFAPVVLACAVCSLITCFLTWQSTQQVKVLSCTSFIISIIVLVASVRIFVPINNYLFKTQEFDPVELLQYVKRWIRLEYFRVAILLIGLATSVLALNSYLK